MRLINLDKIKPMDFPTYEMDGLDVARYLETLPVVDAAEVIRCKDCCNTEGSIDGCVWCDIHSVVMRETDFCSYGERKDNG